MMKNNLTIAHLVAEAGVFSQMVSDHKEPSIYGINDGKKIGTYIEHRFSKYLMERYHFELGNSASGIDLPGINVDIKVTSSRQPQSSCPFRSVEQKVYGLGYHLIVFVYEKFDYHDSQTSSLNIVDSVFVDMRRTGDYQTTFGLRDIMNRNGNLDDILAFIDERRLPLDEIAAIQLAERIMKEPPEIGYLTISNALQWRLQYSRVIQMAGSVGGLSKII